MAILDKNYEEKAFIVSNPTLKYTDDWKQYVSGKMNIYPSYVGIQNNVNMNVPVVQYNKTSPFYNDNPDLSSLFGIHVYDKKFGFDELTLIKPVFGYPYAGYDSDKFGDTYHLNGVLRGNILNGIPGLVVAKLGETVVNTYTDPVTDNIKNSQTKRKLYTSDTVVDKLSYGPYEEYYTYYYVNLSADKTNGVSVRYTQGYTPAINCKFYKKNSINTDTYFEVPPNEVDSQTFTLGTIIETIGGVNHSSVAYLPVVSETYTDNGAIHYFKTDTNEYMPVDLSSYQYLEITDNDYELSASDGYGEDASVNFDLSPSIPRLQLIDGSTEYELRIDINEHKQYNHIGVFLDTSDSSIVCNEQYWDNVDTEMETRDENKLILILSEQNKVQQITQRIVVTRTSYKYSDKEKIFTRIEISFKLDKTIFGLINEGDVFCYNRVTNTRSIGGDKNSFYKTIISNSDDDYESIEYFEKINNDGSVTVVCYPVFSTNNSVYYIGLNPIYISFDGNKQYFRFNDSAKSVQTLKNWVSTKNQLETNIDSTSKEFFITLKCGAHVRCARIINNSVIYDNGVVTMNGVEYNYSFSNLNFINNENNLEYPTTTNTSIFGLFGELSGKINELTPQKTTERFVVYKIPKTNDYMFVVCVNNQTSDSLVKYVSYSPKLCLQIPKLYLYDSNSVFVTGSNNWTDNDMASNIYLQYFDFNVEVLQPELNSNGWLNYDITFNSLETIEKPFDTEMEMWHGMYGYVISFSSPININSSDGPVNFFRVTDTTGLSVVTMAHEVIEEIN